jgi:hypothetical protein
MIGGPSQRTVLLPNVWRVSGRRPPAFKPGEPALGRAAPRAG